MKAELIQKLNTADSQRGRSVQVNVGPSEIGGCGRRLWHRINKTEPTNFDTLRLAAIMGTAIHHMIEAVFMDDARYETEVEVFAGGVMGHVDLIETRDDGTHAIWDWKTTTKGSLPWFGSAQQIAQVQLYGWMANQNGYNVTQVGLVAIARDGNENDIKEIVVPYNEAVALDALARLDQVKAQFDPPAPEKDVAFCKNYCQYFGACPGIESPNVSNLIENEEMIVLVKEFKNLQQAKKDVDAQLDAAKEALQGTNGVTPDGTVVKWSQVAGRQTIDESAVQDALGFVPKKQGVGYERLTVK